MTQTPADPVVVRPPWREATLLAGGYLVVSVAYVILSTWLATRFARSPEQLARIETMKGIGFMVVSAVALWLFNHRQLVRVRRRDSQFRRMDRALQNAEKSVLAGTIASTVAHDINNGLMTAAVSLEDLHDRVSGDPELSALTDEARAAVARIVDWNRRFFDLGGERLLGDVKPFDLSVLLRTTCELAQRHRSLREAQLSQVLPETAPFRGSVTLMQRAVLNLLLNAAEAAGPGERVRLTLGQVEYGRYCIAVEDSGPGVPAALRERILEPFYTSKPEGTGLGLASVVACASFHRGTVTIDDSTLGGARFILTLA